MLCSGCGKTIPFVGAVCPYCQRDKTADQSSHMGAMLFGLFGGAIGYAFDGFFWGAIVGMVAGMFLSFVIDGALSKKSKPPVVRVVGRAAAAQPKPVPLPPVPTTATKMAELKDLLNRDFITLEEFEAKRRDLIDAM